MLSKRTLFILVSSLILLMFVACKGAPPASETPPPQEEENVPSDDADVNEKAPTALPPTPLPAEQFVGDGPWILEFESQDGMPLHGTVHGQGTEIGLILIPMYPGEQTGWQAFASSLADMNYRILTFDFRGYGQSSGEQDLGTASQDVLGAISFLQTLELDTVILVGAGQGGLAAIQAIDQGSEVDGLVVLSSAQAYDNISIGNDALSNLSLPSLWLGARHDVLQEVETLHESAGGEDKTLVIYESIGVSGTYMLDTNESSNITQEILAFCRSCKHDPIKHLSINGDDYGFLKFLNH